MSPETLEAIQKTLRDLEEFKGNVPGDQQKKKIDEYMFCFRNCYTEVETVTHITKKFPSLVPEVERRFFQLILPLTDQKLREAYLKDAEDCAFRRFTAMRDTSEEAKNSQGEASTSHTCDGNCKGHSPTH